MSVRATDLTDVVIVRWPTDAVARTLAAAQHRPRLLIVSEDTDAPTLEDELEDWVRDPVDPVELLTRSDALRRRAAAMAATKPRLDEHGLLHHRGRWVALSPSQVPVLHVLLDRFGTLVASEELEAAYIAGGGSSNPSSIRTALMRLRSRVGLVGLRVEVARGRGAILESDDDDLR